MDGTGVPVVKAETVGRKGKQADGVAKTREAKLWCAFTQSREQARFCNYITMRFLLPL